MHEMRLARSVLGESLRIAEGRKAERVAAVVVEVSPLAVIDVEDLSVCFRNAAAGTVAEDADLRIVRRELTAECSECGESVSASSGSVDCPKCGSRSLEVTPMPDWRITAVETLP